MYPQSSITPKTVASTPELDSKVYVKTRTKMEIRPINLDIYTMEFEINEASLGARNILTKVQTQEEIKQYSGASVTTKGRFMSPNDRELYPNDRPLHLFIQGPSRQSVDLAIQKIHEIMQTEENVFEKKVLKRNLQPLSLTEKVYIGIDVMPAGYNLRAKIIGDGGTNLNYIRKETGAMVTLRGKGSAPTDVNLEKEADEPLHLFIQHNTMEGLNAAIKLVNNLIETLKSEIAQAFSQKNVVGNQILQNTLEVPNQVNSNQVQMPYYTQPNMLMPASSVNLQNPQGILMPNNQNFPPSNGQLVPENKLSIRTLMPRMNVPPPGVHIPVQTGPLVLNQNLQQTTNKINYEVAQVGIGTNNMQQPMYQNSAQVVQTVSQNSQLLHPPNLYQTQIQNVQHLQPVTKFVNPNVHIQNFQNVPQNIIMNQLTHDQNIHVDTQNVFPSNQNLTVQGVHLGNVTNVQNLHRVPTSNILTIPNQNQNFTLMAQPPPNVTLASVLTPQTVPEFQAQSNFNLINQNLHFPETVQIIQNQFPNNFQNPPPNVIQIQPNVQVRQDIPVQTLGNFSNPPPILPKMQQNTLSLNVQPQLHSYVSAQISVNVGHNANIISGQADPNFVLQQNQLRPQNVDLTNSNVQYVDQNQVSNVQNNVLSPVNQLQNAGVEHQNLKPKEMLSNFQVPPPALSVVNTHSQNVNPSFSTVNTLMPVGNVGFQNTAGSAVTIAPANTITENIVNHQDNQNFLQKRKMEEVPITPNISGVGVQTNFKQMPQQFYNVPAQQTQYRPIQGENFIPKRIKTESEQTWNLTRPEIQQNVQVQNPTQMYQEASFPPGSSQNFPEQKPFVGEIKQEMAVKQESFAPHTQEFYGYGNSVVGPVQVEEASSTQFHGDVSFM